MMKHTILVLLLLGFAQSVFGQVPIAARWSSDAPSVLVGEPVSLVLIVEAPIETIVSFPELSEDWEPFEVQSVGEVSKTVNGDTATYRQMLTLIGWRTGEYPTPETYISYQLTPTDAIQRILADPTVISVPSVLDSHDNELRPLKPPISLPYLPPWLLLVVVGVLLSIVRTARRWRSRRTTWQRGSAVSPSMDLNYSPKQRALAEITTIRTRKLSPRLVYTAVADCLRIYVFHQFSVNAPDMTTMELMSTLETKEILSKAQQRDLARMLEYADLVKFADAQPGERAVNQLLDSAEKWVDATDTVKEEITA
jgi:hypothetical protein